MNPNKNDLDYYIGLNYDLIVRKNEDEDGTFFQVFTNELNRHEFYGVGDSEEKAIEHFHESKQDLFADYLKNGLKINEPEVKHEEIIYSGKFIVRTTPLNHMKLVQNAKRDKQSLNSHVNSIIDRHLTVDEFSTLSADVLERSMQSCVEQHMSDLSTYGFRALRTLETESERSVLLKWGKVA